MALLQSSQLWETFKRRWTLPLFTYGLAASALIWVFHGVNLRSILDDFAALDWRWVLLAVLTEISVYFVHGCRWHVLLLPLKHVGVGKAIRAVFVGLFANEVLPFRSGEIIRAYLLGKWVRLPFVKVLSSVVVERVLDGIWLSVAFYLALQFVQLPRLIAEMGRLLAILVLISISLLLYFKYVSSEGLRRLREISFLRPFYSIFEGFHDLGRSPTLILAFLLSVPYLLLQVLPFYALAHTYGLDLGLWESSVVLIIVRLGTILPQAPGNVGTFQFLVVLSLGLFGVEKVRAAGYSVLLFATITLPLLVTGFVALMITGLNLRELRLVARKPRTEVAQAVEPVTNPGD